jgi:hypothetical protein
MQRRSFLRYALATAAVSSLRMNEALVAAPTLADLGSVDQLRAAFNRDLGKIRLILLLSPT